MHVERRQRMDYPHIVKTPDTCRGLPRIDGTRITVNLIVEETEAGMSPAAIQQAHAHVTLAQVHAALAYYHDHREEIDALRKETAAIVEETRAKFPSKLAAARLAQPQS